MRFRLTLAAAFVAALVSSTDSHAFGRRTRVCCLPCDSSARRGAPYTSACISISNIIDGQTLGTSFTVYGTFDPGKLPFGDVIRGRIENDNGTNPQPWQMAAMGNGTWQIDFTGVPLSPPTKTLRIEVFPTPSAECTDLRRGLIIADGAGAGLTLNDTNARARMIAQDYQPSGEIHTDHKDGHMETTVIYNGQPIGPSKGAGKKMDLGGSKWSWEGNAGQNHDLSLYTGLPVTVIFEVKSMGKLRSISLRTKVQP
jgi:hypothetical protein